MLPLFFVALFRVNFLSRQNMKNVKEEKNGHVQEQLIQHDSTDNADAGKKRKVSKTWEAAMRYKGSVIVLDRTLYER
jgi:hypothetical protein